MGKKHVPNHQPDYELSLTIINLTIINYPNHQPSEYPSLQLWGETPTLDPTIPPSHHTARLEKNAIET